MKTQEDYMPYYENMAEKNKTIYISCMTHFIVLIVYATNVHVQSTVAVFLLPPCFRFATHD